MAITQIWKVSNRLDHIIKYTTNEDKTGNENYKELHNVLDYATADYKTEKQFYVSGINCLPETALQEMTITKKRFNKENGIVAFHAIQSFAEGEVTPELCHKIGVELAKEMWGDRFEIIISTHLNTNHYHNHFVINSVSFKDGKRYYDNRSTYAELRNLSDSICEEYGLSTINEKKTRSNLKYANYQNKNFNENSYYVTTKKDIDRAIGMAYSYKDFEILLQKMGYELFYRAGKLSVRKSPYKKNIRLFRTYGENYSLDKIKERIELETMPRIPFLNNFNKNKYYRSYNYKKEKPKGIYALYLHYCYLLQIIPTKRPNNKIPLSIRNDIDKLEKISEETKLLVSNNLETDEQFFNYKESKTKELEELLKEREKLWDNHRKSKLNNINYAKLYDLKVKINKARKEVVLCNDIESRISSIEKNTNEFIQETRKEKELYESIK